MPIESAQILSSMAGNLVPKYLPSEYPVILLYKKGKLIDQLFLKDAQTKDEILEWIKTLSKPQS